MNITEAIRETLDEFLEMSSDELDKVIEQHKEGDIALSLLDAGYFDELYHNKIRVILMSYIIIKLNIINYLNTDKT